MDPLMPPPVRRIAPTPSPTVVEPPSNGAAQPSNEAAPAVDLHHPLGRPASTEAIERMRIESVWLAYGERWVVRDVSLPVRRGEVLALIGASGSGKTTLLRSLNRLTEVTAGAARVGQITLDGQEIGEIEVNSLRRRVSMVFQQPNPFPMSVRENVAYALREEHPPGRRRKRHSRGDLEPAVIDALRRAGLYEEVADDLDHPALRLSGGQQQRLCIARALAVKPEVLLLDEPTSALDPISTAAIEELIQELVEDYTVAIVTHNLQQAARVADYIALFYIGELVEFNDSKTMITRPAKKQTEDYITGRFG